MTTAIRPMPILDTRQIVVDGVRSPVLVGGTGAPGEAVLFVHGNPGSGGDWVPLMLRVAEFATVVAPDMPGFGAADKPAGLGYTLADHAAQLAGVVDALGLERVHIVAHDLGGPFALTWAAAHPDKLASVTLVNTGILRDYRWHRIARVWRTPLVGETVMRVTTLSAAKRVLRRENPGLPDEWVARIAAHMQPAGTKRAVLRLYRSSRQVDLDVLIGSLRARDPDTLVVWGDADAYIPAVQAQRQRETFPRARVEMLPGVGHWAWLEQPERVAAHVVPFLRGQIFGTTSANTESPR